MKLAAFICLAAFLIAAGFYIFRYQFTMRNTLPPSYEIHRWEVDAILRNSANVALVLGTGSMAPAIRAGRPDEVVALVSYAPRDFSLLGAGDLVLFDHAQAGLIVHQLAQLDGAGWISTGSANSRYDSGRITRKNLRGVVTAIYNIKP